MAGGGLVAGAGGLRRRGLVAAVRRRGRKEMAVPERFTGVEGKLLGRLIRA